MQRWLALIIALYLLVPAAAASDGNDTAESDEPDDSSGSGSGDEPDEPDEPDDSSGSGSGDEPDEPDEPDDSSGSGSGDEPDEPDDSSGSGSGDEPDDSSGSGSGDDESEVEYEEGSHDDSLESHASSGEDGGESGACAEDRDERLQRADERLRRDLREAEEERDEELADADDRGERTEAWGEYNETIAEARAEHDRAVARAHDEYDDCRRDADREDVEVEDDDDGFRYQRNGETAVAVDAGRASSRVEAEGVEFESRIDSVLEYRDEDANGAYDLGEPVVQRFALRDANATVRADGALRVVAYAIGNGSLELRYRPSGDDTKFDVVLDAFPLLRNDTRLAVGAAVEGGGGLRVVEVDGAPAVAGTGSGSVGFLSWVQHVEVDGEIHPVGWSVHVSQSAQRQSAIIYWSYPAGDHVVHDPVLGVTTLPVAHLGDAGVFAATAGAAVVVAALGYAWRRRFAP